MSSATVCAPTEETTRKTRKVFLFERFGSFGSVRYKRTNSTSPQLHKIVVVVVVANENVVLVDVERFLCRR
jgi:hypothetical protein